MVMNRATIENLSHETELKYNNLLSIRAVDEVFEVDFGVEMPFVYYKIDEVANCWMDLEDGITQIMSRVILGLHSAMVKFSFIVVNDGVISNIYIGIENFEGSKEVLGGLLCGNFPSINLSKEDITFDDAVENSFEFCNTGFIKGNPSRLVQGSQIDSVINGMKGKKWCYIVNAQPIPKNDTIMHQKFFLDEYSKCSVLKEISFSDTDNVENTSYRKNYLHADKYNDQMEQYNEKYSQAISIGEWAVTVQFGATTEADAYLLGGLIGSLFYGEDSTPEAPHLIMGRNIQLSQGIAQNVQSDIIGDFMYPTISSYLTSNELACYASLPTVDTAGFGVKNYVSFDVARSKKGPLVFGNILKNGTITESEYSLNYNELNRHCLIVGLTGSGKTNTTKNILHNVYEGSERTLPIMVIEPAKKEYWELYKLGFDDLQIYSVGSSNPLCNPYCLNPFERIGNTALQTHIDNVYAAFKASFIMYTPMPYVLERAIYEIYEDYGWDLRTNTNTKGTDLYPTIEDLYLKIPSVVTAMGYDSKMRNDLIGSLQARINSLRLGAKGDTLNVKKSFPIDEILKKNVVIELEDIGDDDVKAFIISMLLIQLVELRRQEKDCQLEVKHLLLIEEAHRLLKNVQSGTGENADPRGAAVEFFCNLLAELRSKGQGFLIADQIPSKLAPDLIKNTNIKIVHRTVDKEDRELMGGAMHMTEEQTDYLSSLKMGEAAIYSEGDNRPKLIKPNYAGKYIEDSKRHLENENQVLEITKSNCYSANNNPDYSSLTDKNFVCRLCKPYCRKNPEQIFEQVDVHRLEDLMAINKVAINGKITSEILNAKFDEILSTTNIKGRTDRRNAKGCMLCHMLKVWNLGDKINKNIANAFLGH